MTHLQTCFLCKTSSFSLVKHVTGYAVLPHQLHRMCLIKLTTNAFYGQPMKGEKLFIIYLKVLPSCLLYRKLLKSKLKQLLALCNI